MVPFLFKALLAAFSRAFYLAVKCRAFLYWSGLLQSVRLPCKVVSVGNITVGGTGKTPLVEWLVRRLSAHGCKVAVLSRGYGKLPSGGGDDEDFIGAAHPESVRRFAGKNRVEIAKKAIAEFAPDVVILDDGFQHRRIKRDLDILAIDATAPFSNGRLLPRGFLREPLSAMKRADIVVLTRTDQAPPSVVEALKEQAARLSGDKPVVESVHKAVAVRNCWNKRLHAPEWMRRQRIYAFCGIGNPSAFVRTLESIGANVVKHKFFPDHHNYSALEIRQMVAEAREFMADIVVTTEKDERRLSSEDFDMPLCSVRVELELLKGEDILDERLSRLIGDIRKPIGATCRS